MIEKKKSKGKSSSTQHGKNKKQRVNAVPANAKSEYVTDNFDSSRLLDIRSDICAMCKEGHDYGLLLKRIMPRFLDMDEHQQSPLFPPEEEDDSATFSRETLPDFFDPLHVWASKYSLSSNRRVFVHLYCAFTSPLVWYNGENWHNLMREVTRSTGLTCSHCKKRGAIIGCHDSRCSIVLHLHCALQNGYHQSRFSSTFLCPNHVEKGVSRGEEVDLSRGQEPIPIQIRDFLNNRVPKVRPHPFGASNPYYYVTANADSDEVVGNSRNVDDLMSCECTDLCDVVENCRCIRNTGRNYTYLGTLMPGQVANHRIMECNLRCSCSYRRCTNRVVEKGLTFRLEVFRQQKPTKHSTPDGTDYIMEWGVRTLEAIPKDAFVCQLNGQFVKGKLIGPLLPSL